MNGTTNTNTTESGLWVSGMTGTLHTDEFCSAGRGRSFGNVQAIGTLAEVVASPYAKGCKRCGSAAIVAAGARS